MKIGWYKIALFFGAIAAVAWLMFPNDEQLLRSYIEDRRFDLAKRVIERMQVETTDRDKYVRSRLMLIVAAGAGREDLEFLEDVGRSSGVSDNDRLWIARTLVANGVVNVGRELWREAITRDPQNRALRLDLIRALEWAGDPAASQAELEVLATSPAGAPEDALRLARIRRYDRPLAAVTIYEEYLRQMPDDTSARNELASLYEWTMDSAAESYEKLAGRYELEFEQDPSRENLERAVNFAVARRDLDRAERLLGQRLATAPADTDARERLIVIYGYRNRRDAIADELERALALDANDRAARLRLIDIHVQAARHGQAATHLEWFLQKDGVDSKAADRLLDLRIAMGDLTGAAGLLRSRKRTGAAERERLRALARVLRWDNRSDELADVLVELAKLEADNAELLTEIAALASWSGDSRRAVAALAELLEKSPDDREIEAGILYHHALLGELGDAIRFLERRIERNADTHQWPQLAELYRIAGKEAAELGFLERMGRLANREHALYAADRLLAMKRFATVLEIYERLHAAHPEDRELADRKIYLAYLSNSDGLKSRILDDFERRSGNSPESLRELAAMCERAGVVDRAIRALEKTVAAVPDSVDDVLRLVERRLWLGHEKEAIRDLENALARVGRHRDIELRLARLYSWQDEFQKSREMYRTLYERYPSDPEVLTAMIETAYWDGRRAEAAGHYRKLVARVGRPAFETAAMKNIALELERLSRLYELGIERHDPVGKTARFLDRGAVDDATSVAAAQKTAFDAETSGPDYTARNVSKARPYPSLARGERFGTDARNVTLDDNNLKDEKINRRLRAERVDAGVRLDRFGGAVKTLSEWKNDERKN